MSLSGGPYKPKYVDCEVLHQMACAVLGILSLSGEWKAKVTATMLKYNLGREPRFVRVTDETDFCFMAQLAELFCAECPHVKVLRPLIHTASLDIEDPLIAAGLVQPLPRHVFLRERGRFLPTQPNTTTMDALAAVTPLTLALKPAIISKRGVRAAFNHLVAQRVPHIMAWQAEIAAWMQRRKIHAAGDEEEDEMRVRRHADFVAAVTLALAAVKTGNFETTFNEIFLACPGFPTLLGVTSALMVLRKRFWSPFSIRSAMGHAGHALPSTSSPNGTAGASQHAGPSIAHTSTGTTQGRPSRQRRGPSVESECKIALNARTPLLFSIVSNGT
ncbi:hypothetical protein BC567DRAFT_253256 [Phyllosticta citribraziliensis]